MVSTVCVPHSGQVMTDSRAEATGQAYGSATPRPERARTAAHIPGSWMSSGGGVVVCPGGGLVVEGSVLRQPCRMPTWRLASWCQHASDPLTADGGRQDGLAAEVSVIEPNYRDCGP